MSEPRRASSPPATPPDYATVVSFVGSKKIVEAILVERAHAAGERDPKRLKKRREKERRR